MKNVKIFGLLIIAILVASSVFAQGPPPLPATAAPLDGGITLALLAGAGIAVKKIWKR